jgi:RNA polymerase sigma-70 factor, ECF subfamily
MHPDPSEITQLLIAWSAGDAQARDRLIPLVYDELRRTASAYLRRERHNPVLQTTALVHEAYLRLVNVNDVQWQNRAQFFALAAHVMRQVLVDHARARKAAKRGSDATLIALDDAPETAAGGASVEILALHDALEGLEKLSPRQGRVVELRFFAGLTTEEISQVLEVSERTILSEWRTARAWLMSELQAQ